MKKPVRLSTILETSNKSVWGNVFWYVIVCIFWECIQYTIHWDKPQILKKFSSGKINGIKNAPYMSWSTGFVSLQLCVAFSFFDSVLFLCFCLAKYMDSLTLKSYNSFQNWNNRKSSQSFAPRRLIFMLQEGVLKFNYICVSWSSPKLTWWQSF